MLQRKASAEGIGLILELAAHGAPTAQVLDALARALRNLTDIPAGSAIFLFDHDAGVLRVAAAAGLSEAFARFVETVPVGPTQPSWGQVVYTERAVIVRDVAQDPLWAPHLALATAHGFRACWSYPLHAPWGDLLGAFALFHGEPCDPGPEDHERVRFVANLASLVLEHHRADLARELTRTRRVERVDPEAVVADLDLPAPETAQPVVRRRVLIVDDNVDIATSLADLLEMGGHETFTAHDGLAAVASAERLRPEVVLLDLGLPMLDGYEACRRIRAQPWGADVIIVAATGWGLQTDRQRTRDAGFDEHFVKPVDYLQLLALLAETKEPRG